MIRATVIVFALLLAHPAMAQEASEAPQAKAGRAPGRASWAGAQSPQTAAAVPLAKRVAETAQQRRYDAFEGSKPTISKTTEETARRAAQIAQSRAATPMVVNAARATIEAAQPNIDGAKAAYETGLLEQFGFNPEADSDERLEEVRPPASHSIVVFGSASIPIDTLRAYVSQLEGTSGALVFRGAPGGLKKIEPFARLARSILAVDPECAGLDCEMRSVPILIDPILFEANGVTQVPAVGQIRKDLFAQHCDDPEGIRATSVHITYGDAALSGHLEEQDRLDRLASAVLDPGKSLPRKPLPQTTSGDHP